MTEAVRRPADDDGLAGELAAAAGRRWWNRWTVCLGAAVLLLAGFIVGVQVQRSYGEPTRPAAAGGQRGGAGFGGFAGARGGAQGGFPAGAGRASGAPGGTADNGADTGQGGDGTGTAATTGTVKLVDGTTVYVQTADGEVLTVRTGGDTAVRVARDGSLKDLKAGDPVTVEGPNSAGTVTATSITAQPK
ncbi:hypothetical protein AB0J86_22770 [Micromonospora sp. NPDC049559]|uniref:hypothetical protein n=1 Tax=Micromonospora sp. NPDC049559 TaxID=3155923 RepID=UPI003433C52D